MRTSSSEVQTQAERRVGQKASRANNHSCFDFFHDSGFHSQVKLSIVNSFSNMQCTKVSLGSHCSGVGKLFAQRAALQKNLKPRAALIVEQNKKSRHDCR